MQYLLTATETDPLKFKSRKPLLDMMASRGFDVHVAIPESPVVEQVCGWKIPVHGLPIDRGSLNPFAEYRTLREFRNLIRGLNPHLSHHFTSKAVLYGSLAGGPAVLATVTGVGFSLSGGASGLKSKIIGTVSRRLHRQAFANCCRVVFQNSDDLDEFVASGLVSKEKCALIRGSGVDMAENHPNKRRPHTGPPRFVMLSRLIAAKGVREFVSAARALRNSGIAAEFVLAGNLDPDNPTGIPREEVDAWVREGIVRYDGPLPNAVEAFAEADVAVLPSYWREGLPRSLVEGAAMGLPVVTTNCHGCRDTVVPEKTGILVEPKDSVQLADAMRRLAESKELRETMGSAGRAFVEERYSMDRVLAETWTLYLECLERAGTPWKPSASS